MNVERYCGHEFIIQACTDLLARVGSYDVKNDLGKELN